MALRNLFRKPLWQHRDPARRAEAVSRMNDPALKAALPEIARSDTDTQVRKAAIERLDDFYLDMRLAYEDNDPAIVKLCMARYRDTLLASNPDAAGRLESEERLKLLRRLEDRQLLDQVRRHASGADIRQAALETLAEPRFDADTAANDPDSRLRLLASQRIDDETALRELAKRVKRSDKALYRAIEQRLQARAIERGDSSAVATQAESLCQQMEALMLHTRQLTPEQFDHIEQLWQHISQAAGEAVSERYQRARQVVGIACGRLEAPKPMEQPAAEIAPEPVESAEQAPATPPEPKPAKANPQLQELVAELEAQGDDMQDLPRWQKKLKEIKKRLSQAEIAASQALLEQIGQRFDALEKAQQQQRQAWLDELSTALDALEEALGSRQLLAAAQSERQIQTLQEASSDWPRRLRSRWQSARKQLSELRSWQRWADNRVRETLCEQAEALLVDRPHPDALAEKLRQLREQWQQLDEKEAATEPSGKPSGGVLRRRFHQATRSAHQQAKPFFEKRQQVRASKTDQMADLAQTLEALAEDLDNPDWKQIEQAISQGRRALRDLPETLPKARKTLAERLRTASMALETHLHDHQERVARIKQGLIEKAEQLNTVEPREASKQAGELMAQWKQAGSAGRRQEQKLWKPFRSALDQARERLDEQFKENREQQQQARQRLVAALEALQAALDEARQQNQELAAGARAAHEQAWQNDQAAADNALRKQQTQLLAAIEQHHQQLAKQQRLDALDTLVEQSTTLQQLEEQRLAGQDVDSKGDWLELFDKRLAALEQETDKLASASNSATREAEALCLHCEIEADLPSPEAWQKQRMDIQVERLNQRMGGGDKQDDLATLVQRWHALGPFSNETWQALRPRMQTVEQHLRQQLSRDS